MSDQLEQRRKRLKNILDTLGLELFGAKLSYEVARTIHQAWGGHRITAAQYFFAASYHLATAEFVMAITKIAVRHPRSVTIHEVFRYAEASPELFHFASPQDPAHLVAEHRKRIQSFETLINTLRTVRNKSLAHLSQEVYADQPKSPPVPPVDMTSTGDLLHELITMLDAYKAAFNNSELYQGLQYVERFVQADVDRLVALLPVLPVPPDPSLLRPG